MAASRAFSAELMAVAITLGGVLMGTALPEASSTIGAIVLGQR